MKLARESKVPPKVRYLEVVVSGVLADIKVGTDGAVLNSGRPASSTAPDRPRYSFLASDQLVDRADGIP
jgi:hypothetical protein